MKNIYFYVRKWNTRISRVILSSTDSGVTSNSMVKYFEREGEEVCLLGNKCLQPGVDV